MPRSHTIDLRWNAIVNDFRRSGLTQADFCRQRDISLTSCRYHFYKPGSSKPTASNECSPSSTDNHFLAVTVLPDPAPSVTVFQPHLELVLANGRRIAIPSGFDAQTLRRLIAIIEEQPCSD
jgi:hypothetical protein